MRFYNDKNTIKVYAVTGTQTVLLTMDIPLLKVRQKGFMGFCISRRKGKGKVEMLNGSKLFPLDDVKNRIQKISPLQTYMWKDYTADPDQEYSYTIEAMMGSWDQLKSKYQTTIQVKTEPLHSGKHSVYFNFGVTGSQAYAKKFEDKNIEKLSSTQKQLALKILGRELYEDGLKKFVSQAKGKSFALRAAFYELDYDPFLKTLKSARNKSVDLQIVYSSKPDQKEDNENALRKAGLKSLSMHRDHQVAQPHNKFMVLLENGTPTQVWTGSTNITIRGIFGHCNTGHWIKDPGIARDYLEYWNHLAQNPPKKELVQTCEKIQPDLNGEYLKKGSKVIFSPRSTDHMLQEYVKMMDAAKDAVCIVYPFNIEKIFKDFYAEDKEFIRFIITDKGGDRTNFYTNDRDVFKTQGALLKSPVENWVKEISTKKTTTASTLYVHNKFFIVDPLGSSPLVVTGSANFSDESLKMNDENMLIIKGDHRVADIYFTEFSRLFDHFLPRYLENLRQEGKLETEVSTAGFSKRLDDQGTWCERYYDLNNIVCKRKKMFTRMKGGVRA